MSWTFYNSSGQRLQTFGFVAATQAEMEAGSSTTAYVTPGRTQHHPGVAKFWVDVDQTGTQGLRDSYNVGSFSDEGTGLTQINFTTYFSDTNYAIVFGGADGVTNDASGNSVRVNAGKGTTSFQMGSAIENQTSGVSSYADAESLSAVGFGDQ